MKHTGGEGDSMGIQLKEILEDKFFKDYWVVAGEKGITREVQAVTLFDAPDGYKWFKGKEFVISTGYLFLESEDYFKEVIRFLHEKGSAGIGVKKDRYLMEIPKGVIDLCDDLDFPMINIPFDEAWIDLINAVNSIAVNRFITRVIDKPSTQSALTPNNMKKKMRDLITKLSVEVGKPVTIIETVSGKTFSHPNGFKLPEKVDIFQELVDYEFDFSKKILCDRLGIYRISPNDRSLYPWIVVPLDLRGLVVAKIIIWESCDPIDYYDLLAIRMATALLAEIYEQVYLYQNFEGKYYDEFIKALVNKELDTYSKAEEYLRNIDRSRVDLESSFIVSCIKKDGEGSLSNKREEIYKAVMSVLDEKTSMFGILEDDTIVILTDTKAYDNSVKTLRSMFKDILDKLRENIGSNGYTVGIGAESGEIMNVRKSYFESLKAIEIGKYIFREKNVIAFQDLGPFGLLRLENLRKKDFGNNFDQLKPIFDLENGKELIETLGVFLECESNYNEASKKLFLHTNTVRYRIAKIQEACDIDLGDPMERLKTEITLKFLGAIKE